MLSASAFDKDQGKVIAFPVRKKSTPHDFKVGDYVEVLPSGKRGWIEGMNDGFGISTKTTFSVLLENGQGKFLAHAEFMKRVETCR